MLQSFDIKNPIHLISTIGIFSIIWTVFARLFVPWFGKVGFYRNVYKSLSKDKKMSWNEKVVSSVHSISLSLYSFYIYFTNPAFFERHELFHFDFRVEVMSCISIGYFVYDFIYVILPNFKKYVTHVIHHIVTLIAFWELLGTHYFHIGGLIMLQTEISTPLINNIEFFKEAGMRKSLLFQVNGVLILIIWGVSRMGVAIFYFFWVFYKNWDDCLQLPVFHLSVAIGQNIGISILNIWWYYRLIDGFLRVLRGKKTAID